MGVISVRLDDEVIQWIKDRGEPPGTFARLAVLKEIRNREIAESRAFLEKHRYTSSRPILEDLREDRASH